MMAGLVRDPHFAIKRQTEGAEGVKGGEERGENRSIIEHVINGAGRRELLAAARRKWTWLRRFSFGMAGMRAGAMIQFMVDRMDLFVNGGQDGILAPEACQ